MKQEITREWLAATLASGDDSQCAAGDPTLFKERTMNTVMRAKMRVSYVEELMHGPDYTKSAEQLTMSAVYPDASYPADGSDENHTYARWTPQADFRMTIQNPDLYGKFKVGDKFYVDFTPAPQ